MHTAAVVGAETSMLRAQLAGLPPGYRPDVAVIIVGGNDVTHRVRLSSSVTHLAEAVSALQSTGCEVVVGTCPDLSALPTVRQPLRALAGRSSRQLAEAQRAAVTELGARAVGLAQVAGPFFLVQPDEMFAIDRFHPSGAGYRRTAKALLPQRSRGDRPPGDAPVRSFPTRTLGAQTGSRAGSSAAVRGRSTEITIATAATMTAPPVTTARVIGSSRISQPRKTATTGLT